MENKKICANCRQELDIGFDAIRVDAGVIGMKDFIPLDKILFFCSEDCIKNYYDLGDLPEVGRRVP